MTNLSGANLNNDAAVGPQGEGRESPSSFPKYPAYKDSGVEWLGDVPEGWSVASLRFFADLITGITPPSDDLSNYAEEGWSWVRPEDLDDSGKPVLASKFLTDQGWAFCRKVKGQSTLICCIGTIGKLGFIETDACTNQQITAVVPRLGGRFYFYAMHALKPAFDAYATGNVLRILNAERLGSVEVAVPIKSEADSIARFLDHETARIDALIEEQQRLIELLKEKRQAVISHAVTKGLDPTVPLKDSGVEWLGEVPAHWTVAPVKLFFEFLDGQRIPLKAEDRGAMQGEYPYYGASGVIDFVNEYIFKDDLVLVSEDGANLLARSTPIAFVARGKYWVNNHAHILRPQDTNLAYWAEVIERQDLTIFVTGAAQPKLTAEALGAIKIAAPPTASERAEIEKFILDIDSKLGSLLKEAVSGVQLLQERRSALISAAVTGKIDVRGWQPPASAPTPELAQEAV